MMSVDDTAMLDISGADDDGMTSVDKTGRDGMREDSTENVELSAIPLVTGTQLESSLNHSLDGSTGLLSIACVEKIGVSMGEVVNRLGWGTCVNTVDASMIGVDAMAKSEVWNPWLE